MIVSLIAAMSKNKVIGKNNSIPWNVKGEQKLFKYFTTGCPIIMGRKTYLSIGRPLPNRTNIVLTRKNLDGHQLINDKLIVFDTISKVIDKYNNTDQEIFIIGGGQIYERFIHLSDRIYLTTIDMNTDGDTFFPDFNKSDYPYQLSKNIESNLNYNFTIYQKEESIKLKEKFKGLEL